EAYRIYALIGAVSLIVSGLLFPNPPRTLNRDGRRTARANSRSPGARYSRFYLATILINLAMYVPFAHLPEAAQASGVPAEQSARILGLLGIASVASRLLLGAMGARFDEWLLYRL